MMQFRVIISAACCASMAFGAAPAFADTRVGSILPLTQNSAVAGCAASRAAAEIGTSAQATQPRGCIFPLRAAPPPVAQPVPPAPPAVPAAPIAPVADGGFGWLAPALAGLAAIVGIVLVSGGGNGDDVVPGISPG